jgi:hypothetical protein
VECVGDNHPLIVLNKIGCIFNWCMVTESIMKWVFWYLSYIISSYKHWNVECVWDNHTFILHSLVVFYILVYWLIKVSWNGCFDINPVLCPHTVVLSLVQLYWPEAMPSTVVLSLLQLYWPEAMPSTVVLSLVQLYWHEAMPSTVVLSLVQLYWPEATLRVNTAVRDSIRLYLDIIQD